MKKIIALIIAIALATGAYFYKDQIKEYVEDFSNKTPQNGEEELLVREFPTKEVEIFEVGKDIVTLNFSKSGVSSAKSSVYVMPEIAGRITDIKVEVGDNVEENDTLVTLGDSLSTDIADLQLNTAENALNLAVHSQGLTEVAGNQAYYSAQIGIDSAKKAYTSTVQSKNDTIDLFEIQIESAEIGLETIEEAYEDAEDMLEDAEDALEDLEDELDDLEDTENPNSDQIAALEAAIEQAEGFVEQAERAEESTENAYDQAELGVDQVETTYYSQINQLNTAIKQSYNQYLLALNQAESANTGAQLQNTGAASQVVQANSGEKAAGLNTSAQKVKAPISGKISQINAEEGNMAAPGQVLIKIDSTGDLTIKTSINASEAKLINTTDKVKVTANNQDFEGEIVSISPSLNEITKKIDIEIEIDDAENLTPGSFVKVHFIVTPSSQIYIPLNSILISDGEKLAKAIEDNKIVYKPIKTGQIIGNYIEVLSGIEDNEKIVKSLTTFIEDGEKVITIN